MKKYEISIYKKDNPDGTFYWRAIMACNCGEAPHYDSVWEDDFTELLMAMSYVLSKYEEPLPVSQPNESFHASE